jgi:hypothetical protein
MLNKIGSSKAYASQTDRLLKQLDDIIARLEKGAAPPYKEQTHRVTFSPLLAESLVSRKIKPQKKNNELHYMVRVNKAMRRLASQNLKLSYCTNISKEDLWKEMHSQEQLAALIITIASDLLSQPYHAATEFINTLINWQSLFNFAKEVLNLYPLYLPDENQSLGLFLIIETLIPMAQHSLEQSNCLLTVDVLLEEIYLLEEIVEWAHRRLTKKRNLVTYENLIDEIETLFYIFRFSIRTLDPSDIIIDSILDDMMVWEQQFDFVMQKLKKEGKLERKTNAEIYELLEEEIASLLKKYEENITSPSPLKSEAENSFEVSHSGIKIVGQDKDREEPILLTEGPFESLYRKALGQPY